MSLVSKTNRTFRPTINDQKCLESSKGAHCGKCTQACPQGIDPRHPEQGVRMEECTKCRACVEACPTHAITMPFLPKAASTQAKATEVAEITDTSETPETTKATSTTRTSETAVVTDTE